MLGTGQASSLSLFQPAAGRQQSRACEMCRPDLSALRDFVVPETDIGYLIHPPHRSGIVLLDEIEMGPGLDGGNFVERA